ncbi:hypothetical protein C5C17_11700 [Pseudoclavibacter sp. RFBA6]|nr:hypothetical protein C5C17_11700 [Pseudoclavibacter sp. RFBA6]
MGIVYGWRCATMLVLVIFAGTLLVWAVPFVLLHGPMLIVDGISTGNSCAGRVAADCERAVADARQGILFTLGGVIAIVGLIVTVRRWRLEEREDVRKEAEARRAVGAHVRTSILSAIEMLESTDPSRRVAGVHLLSQAAGSDSTVSDRELILEALCAHVRAARTRAENEGPKATSANLALRSVLKVLAEHGDGLVADLRGAYIEGLEARDTNWSSVNLTGATFVDCNLWGAVMSERPEPGSDDGADSEGGVRKDLTFLNCSLGRSNFRRVGLVACRFVWEPRTDKIGEALSEADFTGSLFMSTDFALIMLTGVRFDNAVFFDSRIQATVAADVTARGASLNGLASTEDLVSSWAKDEKTALPDEYFLKSDLEPRFDLEIS